MSDSSLQKTPLHTDAFSRETVPCLTQYSRAYYSRAYCSFISMVIKVKVQVYSLVSGAKRHSPDFTQLPSGHRTCSFISHFNSLGSIQPGCRFRRTELFKHTGLHCPTRYHSLLGRESARVSKVPFLGAQRRSIFSEAGDRTCDLSLVRRARYH